MNLSIVIPTYNRSGTIGRALSSIARQTIFPEEVIVVDDGSTDETLQVLRAWESRLPLKIVSQKNAGASAARNTGIRNAAGGIVAFIDSDDEYEPHAIQALKTLFNKYPAAVIAFGDAQVLEGSRVLNESFLRRRLKTEGSEYRGSKLIDPAGLLLYGAFLGGFACRKGPLNAVGGYDESLARVNDRDLYLRLAMTVPGDWVFTWERLETKHYTEGSLSSRRNARLHSETQLRVLNKFTDAPRFRTAEGKRLFQRAAKKSADAALYQASRESPAQVIRTISGFPQFARTLCVYASAARALGLSVVRR